MSQPPLRARTRKRLLVASVGVATVSFACTQKSERYEISTSGNLVAVPIEASVEPVADAGSATTSGGRDAQPAAPESGNARDAASGDGDAKSARPHPLPTTGNLVPPANSLDLR
jgi:hypothetical protein